MSRKSKNKKLKNPSVSPKKSKVDIEGTAKVKEELNSVENASSYSLPKSFTIRHWISSPSTDVTLGKSKASANSVLEANHLQLPSQKQADAIRKFSQSYFAPKHIVKKEMEKSKCFDSKTKNSTEYSREDVHDGGEEKKEELDLIELAEIDRMQNSRNTEEHLKKSKTSSKSKKRKKKKHSCVVEAKETHLVKQDDQQGSQRVHFGTVTVTHYKRGLGVNSVPKDGDNFPLGLTNEKIGESVVLGDVDSVEKEKQLRLRKILEIGSNQKKYLELLPDMNENTILETRQWDYKKLQHSNPLFHPLDERERKELLKKDLLENYEPPSEQPKQKKAKKKDNHKSHHNTRSSKRLHSIQNNSSCGSSGSQEVLPFTYNELEEVKNENIKVKNSRSLSNQGCSCHTLTQSQRRKKVKHYNVLKLKEELHKRNKQLDLNKLTREEMENNLMEIMSQESCCSFSTDCSCHHNGIECHMSTCACCSSAELKKWRKNNVRSQDDKEYPNEYKQLCGNPFGICVVTEEEIQHHWDKTLNSISTEITA